MPRITPETIIAPVIGIALLAALALGGVAFALSRHEEAFRQEEQLKSFLPLKTSLNRKT